jgi:hypothetical protein
VGIRDLWVLGIHGLHRILRALGIHGPHRIMRALGIHGHTKRKASVCRTYCGSVLGNLKAQYIGL